MKAASAPDRLLSSARKMAGLSQRELARRARTAQSVVARIELGDTDPTFRTLQRLIRASGFALSARLERVGRVDRSVLDDIPRILRLTPEDRLREVEQVNRFVVGARRV